MRQLGADGAADLTRGGGPYACLRIGLASCLPAMPDEGRREGSLVKSVAALTTSWFSAAPPTSPLFAPADRHQAPPRRERQRELRRVRRVGGASGPSGAP
jgi:hypothetical protein